MCEDTMNAGTFFVILALSLFQVVAESDELNLKGSDEKLNRNRRQEEDTFNYIGLWISIIFFLAFDGMIVVFGIYKSYFGEIHMPVKREELVPNVRRENSTSDNVGKAEMTAVNPTFIGDNEDHAVTRTRSQTEAGMVEVAVPEHGFIIDCTSSAPVIYKVG